MDVAVAAGLVVATVILRGHAITEWRYLNPDETGLLLEARAALRSPVPFSTWLTGTLGPYWPLFLAGLATLGAPLTPAFAHLLTAVLLALTAAALFVAASRAIGRGPALVVTMVWWLPIATTFAVGVPEAYNSLSTEYLPVLLVVASALVPREQLAARPWLFAVLGVLAGFAFGAKFQIAPLACAFAVAQVIVLRSSVRRIVVSVLWWLAGALLPVASIVLVTVVSPATNWVLVEQNFSFLGTYAAGPSPVQRFALTFGSLNPAGGYILVALAGLIWLGRHSDKWSNVARVVLITGGLTAMLIGGMGFPPVPHPVVRGRRPRRHHAGQARRQPAPAAVITEGAGRGAGNSGGPGARDRLPRQLLATNVTPDGAGRVLPRFGPPQPHNGPRVPARIESHGLGLGGRTLHRTGLAGHHALHELVRVCRQPSSQGDGRAAGPCRDRAGQLRR